MFRIDLSVLSKSAVIRTLLVLIVVCYSLEANTQSRTKLEKKKQESLKKIRETEKIIRETKTHKQATIGQLTALSEQIKARQELINSVASEITYLESDIREKEYIINALESDLESLKEEYGEMIYSSSKMDHSIYKLAFIFSAESFNQMIMRMKFFEQYSEARKNQLEQIEKVKEYLEAEIQSLDRKKREKNELLGIHTEETSNLNNLKLEKNKVVKELSKRESDLRKELKETQKSITELENKIREIIEAERKKAIEEERIRREEERKRKEEEEKRKKLENKTEPKTPIVAVPKVANAFEGNMHKLPWPVGSGSIVSNYGRQKHPTLNIEVNNLGVGIQTTKGEQVKAVFAGKVISINEIPGMNKMVMIQHGDYFTVYAKLKKVYVKKDQEVATNEVIGEVFTSKEEVSMVEFQVWKGNSHLNPEDWLGRK